MQLKIRDQGKFFELKSVHYVDGNVEVFRHILNSFHFKESKISAKILILVREELNPRISWVYQLTFV